MTQVVADAQNLALSTDFLERDPRGNPLRWRDPRGVIQEAEYNAPGAGPTPGQHAPRRGPVG